MPETLSQVSHAWLCRMQALSWAGVRLSELPPKPLTLLSQHVSLLLKMRNPVLKRSTLNILLGGEFDDWALKQPALSEVISLACDCHRKENCSVSDSSGLLSQVTALVCISQPVKWCVLVLWHWDLFPLSLRDDTCWATMLWVQPLAVLQQGRTCCG